MRSIRPGAFRYEPPYPKPVPPAVKPAGGSAPNTPLAGPPLGFPRGPEDLLVDANGEALRIDKAFSWEAPLAVHGMMHTVIANAVRGDPYPIDTLFLYMANMGWNSAMNTSETMAMLAEKNPDTGDYRIPHIIYSDAYYSEMVAYADLILPDTTYLERYDCISLLDRPISNAEAAADAIRQPVIKPDRDVRPFQDVLIELGARLQLPGLIHADGTPKYPGLYPDYIVNHQRSPGVGLLAGWRGANGGDSGTGAVNPRQLERYIENECFWRSEMPEEAHYFKPWNAAYLKWAIEMGFLSGAEPIFIELYSETLQKFRLAARGHGTVPIRRGIVRASTPISIRCRSGMRRSAKRRRRAITDFMPSRSARWRCITPGDRRTPGCGRSTVTICCTSTGRLRASSALPTAIGSRSPAPTARSPSWRS